jgi:hypothetical protein
VTSLIGGLRISALNNSAVVDSRSGIDWSALKPGSLLLGVDAHGPVDVIASSAVSGTSSFNVVYRRLDGSTGIFVADERTAGVTLLDRSGRWTFDGDPALFRLVTEAHRIRLAYLFDPLLAVHTSLVEPLPHQITAVYHELLTRQPLRYLLADDPGAGKTIMTGTFHSRAYRPRRSPALSHCRAGLTCRTVAGRARDKVSSSLRDTYE